jgi:hypothetical protein
VADDFEVAGVLDTLNRAGQGTWHLGGGRKTGAWVAEDRDGVRAVLKRHSSASTRRDLDGTAPLVARARARGWPTPTWLAWGLDRRRRPYVLAELVAGEHLDALDDVALDALLAVLDRQLFSVHGRHAAPEPVLTRLAACAIDRDGAAVTTVCLASALFDWCVFATSGWEPEAVTAYLLKAASLFERLS